MVPPCTKREWGQMQPAIVSEPTPDTASTVVATMRQLGVVGLPRNYEIFYEALTGSNPELSLAVVALSKRPTQEDLDKIGRKFFAQNHGYGIVEHARDILARELEDVAVLLRSERNHIEKYGRVLGETSDGLNGRSAISRELLQKIVGAISVATTSTIEHGQQLATTLSDKSAELESVKSKLEEYKLLADTDPLTQICNRRAFDKEIARIYNTNKGILFNALILTDIDRFMADVASVREKGYFIAHGEITADTASVSAPVRDHTGVVVAALTISAPADRFSAGLEKVCIECVRSGAAELSRMLGFVETLPKS